MKNDIKRETIKVKVHEDTYMAVSEIQNKDFCARGRVS